jgi:glycosyltransferase involved in cell wall biosynthesis
MNAATLKESSNRDQSKRKPEMQDAVLLLDLGGDRRAALDWAHIRFPELRIDLLQKADLKFDSKRRALARVRGRHPSIFAFFTVDLDLQSNRGPMILFAAAAGARRIVFADATGREVERSRLSAFLLEVPRLGVELAAGYLLVVPFSWLITLILAVASRRLEGATGKPESVASPARNPAPLLLRRFKALFVRPTLVADGSPGGGAGGLASHTAGFVSGAIDLGHNFDFIVASVAGIDPTASPVILRPTAALGAGRALFELYNNLYFTARAIAWTFQRRTRDANFIYQRYSRFNWTGVVLSRLTFLPLVLEFNGSEVWIGRHWDPIGQLRLLGFFERVNLRAASLIVVVSDAQQRSLVSAGVDVRRILVNPNGVDTEIFKSGIKTPSGPRRAQFAGREDIVVGFTGTFGPWHGAPIVARAAERLPAGSQIHFLFVGDGDRRAETEAIFTAAGLDDRVTFVGRIPQREVPAYLEVCDILVSPQVPMPDGSEFFGSPTKLFEYMAMGKPVIASRLGQIDGVIVDGKSGVLVEPGNADQLARAIERLAGDEALRVTLGENARARVEEHYTWRQNAARVFDAAAKICSPARQG